MVCNASVHFNWVPIKLTLTSQVCSRTSAEFIYAYLLKLSKLSKKIHKSFIRRGGKGKEEKSLKLESAISHLQMTL